MDPFVNLNKAGRTEDPAPIEHPKLTRMLESSIVTALLLYVLSTAGLIFFPNACHTRPVVEGLGRSGTAGPESTGRGVAPRMQSLYEPSFVYCTTLTSTHVRFLRTIKFDIHKGDRDHDSASFRKAHGFRVEATEISNLGFEPLNSHIFCYMAEAQIPFSQEAEIAYSLGSEVLSIQCERPVESIRYHIY
ncbi:hypothetical protein OBBRIDRAFT_808362 [Obba rivulosa]|uniref:Uncharacterized protein n=1 Tax=Obba rivulosa TaxID=1052685 RepID=A0A8E2ALP6_9APHY|nr:hypothetical protein OBBRIDRAFT_808362 [Obba rivulosa]